MLGDTATGEKPLDLKYLQTVASHEIAKGLEGIDLSKVALRDDGVIIIPYNSGAGRFVIQIARRGSPEAERLVGFEGNVSEKYEVRIAAKPASAGMSYSEKIQAADISVTANPFRLKSVVETLTEICKNAAYLWDPDLALIHNDAAGMLEGSIDFSHQSYTDLVARYQEYMEGGDWQKSNTARYRMQPNERIAYFCMEYGITEHMNTYGGGLGILAGDHLRGASDRYAQNTFVAVGLAWKKGYYKQEIKGWWQGEEYPPVPLEQFGEIVKVKDKRGREADLVLKIEAPAGGFIYAKAWRLRIGRVELYLLDTDIDENKNPAMNPLWPNPHDITANLYHAMEREWRFKQEYLLGVGGMRLLEAIGIKPAALHINEGHAALATVEILREELDRRAAMARISPATAADIRRKDPKRASELGIGFDQAVSSTKARVGFTSHTPIAAGNEMFDQALFEKYFRDYCALHGIGLEELFALAKEKNWPTANLSKLAISLSADVSEEEASKPLAERSVVTRNGVSMKGGEVSKDLYGDRSFGAVTNAVDRKFWQSPVMKELLESRWAQLRERGLVPALRLDELSSEERRRDIKVLLDNIMDEELLRARDEMKEAAVAHLEKIRGVKLDKDAFTIVISRRSALYKRLGLMLGIDDGKSVMEEAYERQVLDDLIRCARENGMRLQLVFAGKAHPQDQEPKNILAKILRAGEVERWSGTIIFVPNYDIEVARDLVQIATVWHNNPLAPQEASGTSGMKAAANGVPSVSTPDGWVLEADAKSTVFLFGRAGSFADIDAINRDFKLRKEIDERDLRELESVYTGDWRDRGTEREKGIINMYRYHSDRWAQRMRGAIYDFMVNFDTTRLIEEYESKMYAPLVMGGRRADPESGLHSQVSAPAAGSKPSAANIDFRSDEGKVTELFEVVENNINNERARTASLTNRMWDYLTQGNDPEPFARFENTAAIIKHNAELMVCYLEDSGVLAEDEGLAAVAQELKASMSRLDSDSIIGSMIVLARRAKLQDQKLIVGLETDWIPGYAEKGSLQQGAISSLVREVESLDETLLSMGLENVVVIHKSKDELATAVSEEAVKSNTKLSNVVILGSSATLNSDAFASLRSTPDEARAFMAAVDPSELESYYKDHKSDTNEQLTIRLMEMLCMALELAVGKEPPQLPIIASYDKALRIVVFLPKAEPADYEELRRFYNAAQKALQAA